MIKITRFVFNPFSENTLLLVDEATHDAAVVDPGMSSDREREIFDNYISDHSIKLTQIINTHLHLDHCFSDTYLAEKYSIPVLASEADEIYGKDLPSQMRHYGITDAKIQAVSITRKLKNGDIIEIGDSRLKVISVPGHTPGGLALYCKEQDFVISGDSLFETSIGRTDLPGGDHRTLIESIKKGLFTLPDNTTVIPGHGDTTTIGYEKKHNPYVC
ncbi:MAG: MBL fold metallo-hydrolase [Muribaculaceae bacterium]|nr:MBL fold metallo-hydrolase [Muribaculaceae bacterium]